jgi:hypothetical protein
MLVEKWKKSAPFMFSLLHTFSTSPNKYRKQKTAQQKCSKSSDSIEAIEDIDWEDDLNVDENAANDEQPDSSWSTEYEGFTCNPIFVHFYMATLFLFVYESNSQAIVLAISMLAFVHNRSTNLLPLLLGLFFKISGTSSRVIKMLSNTGVCVSGQTIERLKGWISEDAIHLAVELIKSSKLFFTIFDNINIFLRKSQQWVTNQNTMIHATNSAIIAINDVEASAEDLAAKHALHGNCANATFKDILPTKEDDTHMALAFEAHIANMLVRYSPKAKQWKDYKEMLDEVSKMMPQDRPLKVEKTDARPFGVFDVNEGSKKCIVKVLEAIQQQSTLSVEEWSSKVRVIVGDWLTSNNLQAARHDRSDDINEMEQLGYPEENSAAWHNALQASHCLMCTHYGHAVEDPTSLAAHKGLLHRTWDVNKPNYAAAKALVCHLLIAWLLHCVMYIIS